MRRRSFLGLTGWASMGAALGFAPRAAAKEARSDVEIDRERLDGRNQNRSTVVCRHGIVGASQPLATLAGVEVLKAGGSAIDAAICTNAVLSVVEPMNCGPGGDLFAIVWSEKDQGLFGLNASGRSPYAWSLDKAADLGVKAIPAYTPLAWSVPGCVSGWEKLHQRFGRKTPAELLEPAIRYAREGFPLSPIIARGFGIDAERFPTLAATFEPDGKLGFGDIHTNPALADSFELLAREGWRTFYEGEIAERIVRYAKAN